jgi:phosphoglycolate phosphatase
MMIIFAKIQILKLTATNIKDLKKVKAIIWDWNGTLLDDLKISIAAMNQMLEKRNQPLLKKEKYKEIFTFPVRDYYSRAGLHFADEQWDEVAMEFIAGYRATVSGAAVHAQCSDLLRYLALANYRQFVLSAMQHDFLIETIGSRLDLNLFEEIVGLNNHYAHTKVDNAIALVKKTGLDRDEILMIGDTLHDFEVAEAAGIMCILFSGGHHSRARLKTSGTLVIDELDELRRWLLV